MLGFQKHRTTGLGVEEIAIGLGGSGVWYADGNPDPLGSPIYPWNTPGQQGSQVYETESGDIQQILGTPYMWYVDGTDWQGNELIKLRAGTYRYRITGTQTTKESEGPGTFYSRFFIKLTYSQGIYLAPPATPEPAPGAPAGTGNTEQVDYTAYFTLPADAELERFYSIADPISGGISSISGTGNMTVRITRFT